MFLLLHLFLPVILLSFCFSCLFSKSISPFLFWGVAVRNKDNFCSSGLSFSRGVCREGGSCNSEGKSESDLEYSRVKWLHIRILSAGQSLTCLLNHFF